MNLWTLIDLGNGLSVFKVNDDFFFHKNTEEWAAVCGWLEFHQIDPKIVPLHSEIYRNEVLHQIVYLELIFGKDGHMLSDPQDAGRPFTRWKTEKGEGGPLPWPKILGDPQPVDKKELQTNGKA